MLGAPCIGSLLLKYRYLLLHVTSSIEHNSWVPILLFLLTSVFSCIFWIQVMCLPFVTILANAHCVHQQVHSCALALQFPAEC